MMSLFYTFTRLFFYERSSLRFIIGVIAGLALSISIILATIGIMDGFTWSLVKELKSAEGDITLKSAGGFFRVSPLIKGHFYDMGISQYSGIVQSEGFLIANEISKGVIIKGVESGPFAKMTKLNVRPKKGEAFLGKQLAEYLRVVVGDRIVLAFANGNSSFSALPSLESFKVAGLVDHKIYQKNIRLVYLNLNELQELLNLGNRVNNISLNIPNKLGIDPEEELESGRYMDRVRKFAPQLIDRLGFEFSAKPFWLDYSYLIKAVKSEKSMIGLSLQIIVIVAIFNVLAFIIFLREQKSKEMFLLKALGMGQTLLNRIWYGIILFIWISSCLSSFLIVQVFDWCLKNLSIFHLPQEVYGLGRIFIFLDLKDYLLVFAGAFLWLFIISWFGLGQVRKKGVLQGLRKEFA